MFFCKHNKLPLLCDLLEGSAEFFFFFFSISELVKWWAHWNIMKMGWTFVVRENPNLNE